MFAFCFLWLLIGGGYVYWIRGQSSTVPKPIYQILFALPYATLVCVQYNWYIALIILVITTLGVWTGHGNFQPLEEPQNPPSTADDERLEFIIKPLKNKIPQYWYKVLGLFITGLSITLPTGLVLLNPWIVLSAVFKPLAYMTGWYSVKYQTKIVPTQVSEILTGAGLWVSLLMGV